MPHPDWQGAVEAALAARLTWSPAGRGSFDATWRGDGAGLATFVKVAVVDVADAAARFAGEAAGLELLASTNAIRVPRVLASGAGAGYAFLALEWLKLGAGGRDAALGEALARLHRHAGPRFGWERDNTIGATPQRNRWHDDWASFWTEERLGPQLAAAAARGPTPWTPSESERLLAAVPALLEDHHPEPALLHGDLWAGNAGQLATGAPVVFDPAVYYGDRETDLAMTALFGGFAPGFYAAYARAWPLPAGHVTRRTLYNLYHVLNHFNLFGGGYGRQAAAMMKELLRQI